MPTPSHTPLLDTIASPEDMRGLTDEALRRLADELRAQTISVVSRTGGHLGAGLGVVELTVALHAVFNTPEDVLIWDVSHQCYPHKILTGRREAMEGLRQEDGLSGFTKRSESPYDPFGAGHSSTSISAALGFALARDLQSTPQARERHVIAVIGDGAMSAGMAYEALNNAGQAGSRLIVILNDNAMSIAPPVGAMAAYLARQSDPEETAPGQLFADLGFTYQGPQNGHDLPALLATLRHLRDTATGPVLLHLRTEKGRGYAPAEAARDKGHGVGKFDIATGAQHSAKPNAPSYTSVFSQSLIAEASLDERICAITAAMPDGTGLGQFGAHFPERCFDVGIAEQHAVTFSAGLAAAGMVPFCALYSTFLQRAYDQVVHDVALQGLPVRFAIDRAGLVGADGATHAGAYDIAFLANLPGMVVMAAADEAELVHMVRTAARYEHGPIALRYPRGTATGIPLPDTPQALPIGRGRVIREGRHVALLSLGTRLGEARKAADMLEAAHGFSPTLADARFAKPLDQPLIQRLAQSHEVLITVEEGATGGFGSHVGQFLNDSGLLGSGLPLGSGVRFRALTLPDRILDQAPPSRMYHHAGLQAAHIATCATNLLQK